MRHPVDLKPVPEHEGILRAIPETKEKLEINVELAAPDDFIPPLPGWEARSRFISKEGKASFFQYDFYAQALAKLERGHTVDLTDVGEMRSRGLIDPEKLESFLEAIEPMYRYPAVDPRSFRRKVEAFVGS